jgi:hypothetical protein
VRGGCACSPARASSRPMLVLACWQIHQDGKPKPAEPDSGVPDSSEPDSSKCKAERLKKLNEELNVQSKFRSNGLDAAFEWRYGDGEAKLSVEELRFCAPILRLPGVAAWSECPPWQCPSSAPAPPQGTPGGSGQPGTSREDAGPLRVGNSSHCLGCSSQPPKKSSRFDRLTFQVVLECLGH